MPSLNIHRVEKITITEIWKLPDSESYTTKIRVKSKGNTTFDFTLFSTTKSNLAFNIKNIDFINKNID